MRNIDILFVYFYTTMQESKYKTQAQNKVNDWKKQMDVSFAIIDNGLNYWESQYVYKENVGAVFNNYNNLYHYNVKNDYYFGLR